jgi:hypothetical protein
MKWNQAISDLERDESRIATEKEMYYDMKDAGALEILT